MYCAAFPELGLGVAIKMDDGNNARACEVVMATLIGRLMSLADEDATWIGDLGRPKLVNWNGIQVGQLQPAF
jgi:L-asparaginase II